MAFLRPGSQRPSAFGVSFDTDHDAAPPPPTAHRAAERLSLHDQRRRLPIFAHRAEILYLVETHATTVIVGETGSGKTTQIPQYLHESGWTGPLPSSGGRPAARSGGSAGYNSAFHASGSNSGAPDSAGMMIACTQPRRVAAMTVAARVAEEMGVSLGREVGYAIRFEDVCTPGVTRLRFCTDGVLLREMMADPLLTKYSVVMVDEAHERSVTTDLLLGLLKKVQKRRPGLRLVISSATIDAARVAAFFDAATSRRPRAPPTEPPLTGGPRPGAAVSKTPALLSVEGRTHSVQVHYLEHPAGDYVRAAVEAAVAVHLEDLPGDILVFVTGQEECERCVALLEEEDARVRREEQGERRG
jgi:ATP-dependent RNA helicase DDX35